MANEQQAELQDLSADELKARANSVFEQYRTPIFVVIGSILALVVGAYWYITMYKAPREKEAQIELYRATLEFQRDSLNVALNGNTLTAAPGQANTILGFTGIIEDYSGTEAANLAHYYAGATTLRLGQPQLALQFLDAYSGEAAIQTQAYHLMGDAHSELGDMETALNYYEKAANGTSNDALTLYAKYKAARLMEFQGKLAEAKAYYQAIMDTDAKMAESMGVDKDLVRLQ